MADDVGYSDIVGDLRGFSSDAVDWMGNLTGTSGTQAMATAAQAQAASSLQSTLSTNKTLIIVAGLALAAGLGWMLWGRK